MLKYLLLLSVLVLAACSGDDDVGKVVTTFRMEGSSMEPTLSDGDEVEVLEFERPVERGDIVLFVNPVTGAGRQFVKRVIAGPGQTVEIDPGTGEVSVDGEPINEQYIQGLTACGNDCSFVLPGGQVGRDDIPSPESIPRIYGDGLTLVHPCEPNGCYFVMGDNRQNSADSRQGWLLPIQNIIGLVAER